MKQLCGLLLLAGFVAVYWQWGLAILLLVLLVKAASVAYREFQTERAATQSRFRALIQRADEQHRWASAGDTRGVYGMYPPAV